MKFKGKPTVTNPKEYTAAEVLDDEQINEMFDEDGYVYGYLVGGEIGTFIVGGITDVDEDYASLAWWCPVDPETVEMV